MTAETPRPAAGADAAALARLALDAHRRARAAEREAADALRRAAIHAVEAGRLLSDAFGLPGGSDGIEAAGWDLGTSAGLALLARSGLSPEQIAALGGPSRAAARLAAAHRARLAETGAAPNSSANDGDHDA